MKDRADLTEWVRAEIVGPSIPLRKPEVIGFNDRVFHDAVPQRRGGIVWRPGSDADEEEILYYDRETPHRKFGAGILHPSGLRDVVGPETIAATATDTLGVDAEDDADVSDGTLKLPDADTARNEDGGDSGDDFEVTSSDVRFPSTIGMSFCVNVSNSSKLIIRLPQKKRFSWAHDRATPVNGRYEACVRKWTKDGGAEQESPMWRRLPAVTPDAAVVIGATELAGGEVIRRDLEMPPKSPIRLTVEAYVRAVKNHDKMFLVTVVLRNSSRALASVSDHEQVLYQSYFEVAVEQGVFAPYPESSRPFESLDDEEQSLALLYRESATWGIGHGCAAAWEANPNELPKVLCADVMPAVELPSMTADVFDSDNSALTLSMRQLASLTPDGSSAGWTSLSKLASLYQHWISQREGEIARLPPAMRAVAQRHIELCKESHRRIENGITLLRSDSGVLEAFRLANQAMLLQQISSKQLSKRPLSWDTAKQIVFPQGQCQSPATLYERNGEGDSIGKWRAFQIAFLLSSIDGLASQRSHERELVDLIWFPTGGGKTEAYLGAMAFYMFHQRLSIGGSDGEMFRDGTNVFMRYTLRMLTTQQFQRAASLICAMEHLRRTSLSGRLPIRGRRFSLGLWIGSGGTPNNISAARAEMNAFRSGKTGGNPLVLTECPWCRSEIGLFDGKRPARVNEKEWVAKRVRGIMNDPVEGPRLHCPDPSCEFGVEDPAKWLPIEVIDERIYQYPPSLVIATADKFAIIAYRPDAGALFGRSVIDGEPTQTHFPPGLIIQDELHLIAGPLGTMYGLYEGVIEKLCSYIDGPKVIKPKLIASTATIRGAGAQVAALYARVDPRTNEPNVRLFPSPGLLMGDSFFGRYFQDPESGKFPGRLYLGIHANEYASVLTAQVRAFAAVLCRSFEIPEGRRDPWWTLLVFYNSIRELSGAKTLFDADIRSRLKFLFNREDFPPQARRTLKIVEELTSRLSQSEIVEMMDRLSAKYDPDNATIDACLASSIIEVGVDIDRLSLMGVVGQPKTTAQYIQVTGRVGRRWWERPGLVLMLYSPSKSRDRSHYEQFHSYHRRLYERVEPTSATPFALSAIQRALPGALILWARQQSRADVRSAGAFRSHIDMISDLLRQRCNIVQSTEDRARSLLEMERVVGELKAKWEQNPQEWEEFPPSTEGEYLMLWPGQFATHHQKMRGVVVPSSMRQVDGSAELTITQAYSHDFED